MKLIEFAITFEDPQSADKFSTEDIMKLREKISFKEIEVFGGREANKKRLILKSNSELLYKASCIKYLHVKLLGTEINRENIEVFKDMLLNVKGIESLSYHGEVQGSISMTDIAPEKNPLFFDQQHLFISPLGVDNMYGWTIPGGAGKNVSVFISDFGLHENKDLDIENISGRTEESDHGTAVSSVIGAKNNDLAILGVAYEAKLYYTGFADLDKIIPYAKAGDVVNISGSYNIDGLEYPFITYHENSTMVATLAEMGVTCCYSSGNASHNIDTLTDNKGHHFLDKNSSDYEPSVAICVGGYTGGITLRRAYAGGSLVDVFALSSNVPVLWEGGYSYQSGTSFSTPIITGLIAQVQSILIEQGKTPLSPLEIKDLISNKNNGVTGLPIYETDKAVMPDLRRILSSLSITSSDVYNKDYGIGQDELNIVKQSVFGLFADESFNSLKSTTTLEDISASTALTKKLKPGETKIFLLQLLIDANKLIGISDLEMINNFDFSESDKFWIFYNGTKTFGMSGVTIDNDSDNYIGLAYQDKLQFSTESYYQISCKISVSEIFSDKCEIKFGAVFPALGSIWSSGVEKTVSLDESQLNKMQTIDISFLPTDNNFSPKFPCLYITGAKKITIQSISCKQLE